MKNIILFLVVLLVVLVWIGYWLTNSSSPQVENGCKVVRGCDYWCVSTDSNIEAHCPILAFNRDYSWQICGKNSEDQCGWRMSVMGRVVNVFEKPKRWIEDWRWQQKLQQQEKRAKEWKEEEEKRIREYWENEAR